MPKTYEVTVRFTTPEDGDEHLRDGLAIRAEVESWLQSLDADVHNVRVREQEVSAPSSVLP